MHRRSVTLASLLALLPSAAASAEGTEGALRSTADPLSQIMVAVIIVAVFASTLYCLETGHSCTGTTCPLGAEPAPRVGTPPYPSPSRPASTGLAGPGELR